MPFGFKSMGAALSGAVDSIENATGVDLPDEQVAAAAAAAADAVPSMEMIVQAFQDALGEAVEAACEMAQAAGGFAENLAIKISLPDKIGKVDLAGLRKKLKMVGKESWIDDINTKMNEAAEAASKFAKDIFMAACAALSLDKAKELIEAGGRACTNFFKEVCSGNLISAMLPHIEEAMAAVDCAAAFEKLRDTYNKIPFVTKIDFDIEDFCVTKAVDGLFQLVGDKEESVRADPGGSASGAVGDVFGYFGSSPVLS